MSDLLDLIRQKQKKDKETNELKVEVESACYRLAPVLYKKLLREVDRDLICTEEKELLFPRIHEAACEVLQDAYGESSQDEIVSMMIERLSETVWQMMVLRRSQNRRSES